MSGPTEGTIIRCPHCQKQNRVRAVATGTPRCANCHEPLPWIVTADQGDFEAQTTSSVPVLVDFWAPWCRPCLLVSPVIERLAARYVGRLKVVKVNVDDNPQLAARFRAMSIPTLVLIEDGREVDRQVGAPPEAQLVGWVESRLGAPAG